MLTFNDDTLLHSIGFNLMRFEGILKYGIVSYNYAKEHNILYAKNYNFTLDKKTIDKKHLGDSINETLTNANYHNIYLTRMLYVSDDPLSAYNLYATRGISFIIEKVSFISDKTQEFIKRSDEVIVKDYIPLTNIKGITIPNNFYNVPLNEVGIIANNMMNYDYIVNNVTSYLKFLQSYHHEVDITEISYLLKDFKTAATSLRTATKHTEDYEEALADYKDIINEINALLAEETYKCFTKILGTPATIGNAVEYINKKYHNLEIINLEDNEYNKKFK